VRRFLFGRYVESDLRQIRDHIRKDNPESARQLMVRFVNVFRLLADRPEIGHAREDLRSLRFDFGPLGPTLSSILARSSPSRS
jgi:plasmid stabilization system protein ParE